MCQPMCLPLAQLDGWLLVWACGCVIAALGLALEARILALAGPALRLPVSPRLFAWVVLLAAVWALLLAVAFALTYAYSVTHRLDTPGLPPFNAYFAGDAGLRVMAMVGDVTAALTGVLLLLGLLALPARRGRQPT